MEYLIWKNIAVNINKKKRWQTKKLMLEYFNSGISVWLTK